MKHLFYHVFSGFIIAATFLGGDISAREIFVATPDELKKLDTALPGDVFIFKNGTWTDTRISVKKGGSAERPLVIRAETPGDVVFTGNSTLEFRAPYVTADGFLFSGPHAKGDAVALRSHHGILRNSAIIDYNPQNLETKFSWVTFAGENNLVDHCYFAGKDNRDPVINNYFGFRHNAVTACYFKDIPHKLSKYTARIFEIWGGVESNTNADFNGGLFTVQGNLFEHAGGDGSIIVIKSNHNRVIGNTFLASGGVINMRAGNFNMFEDNIFLGMGVKGSQGIRMSGMGHIVQGNYISGCDEGIMVSCGDYIEKDLTGKFVPTLRGTPPVQIPFYKQVGNLTLKNNVLVGNKNADLDMGARYRVMWPAIQTILLPEDNLIENNRIVRPLGGVAVVGTLPDADTDPVIPKLAFRPNQYVGNVIVGGTNGFEPSQGGFKLEKLPADWSEAKESAKFIPLTAADVGPDWVRNKGRYKNGH